MKSSNTFQIATLVLVGILAILLGYGYKVVLRQSENICESARGEANAAPQATENTMRVAIPLTERVLSETHKISIVLRSASAVPSGAPRAFLFCHPQKQFRSNLTPGWGVIAELDGLKDISSQWVNDYYTTLALKTLAQKHPKMRRYIAVGGQRGLDYLNDYTALIDGAVVAINGEFNYKADELSEHLANFSNIPLAFIFSPDAQRYPGEALEELMTNAAQPRKLLTYAVNPPDESAQLAAAFNWLTEQQRNEREIFWRGKLLPSEPQRWLAIDALEQYNTDSSLRACISEDGRIKISASNILQFTLLPTHLPSETPERLTIEINERVVGIYAKTQKLSFSCQDDGTWAHGESDEGDGATKHAGYCGPIGHVLQAPAIIIYGTSLSDTAVAWKRSAEKFANDCQESYGYQPKVIADQQCTQEELSGRNLILFGSPEENSIANMLLRENPGFLRQIFSSLPEESQNLDDLCAVTIVPADEIASNQSALIVLSDHREAIPLAWRALLHSATSQYDFVFYRTKRNECTNCGSYDYHWQKQ